MVDRLKGFVYGTKKTSKRKLRQRYENLRVDFDFWQPIVTSTRAPLDRLREAYERYQDGQDRAGNICCVMLYVSPDRALATMIKATLDEFDIVDRENTARRLANVEEASDARVNDCSSATGPSTKTDESDEDDDGSESTSVAKSLAQLMDNCSQLAKRGINKAMSRSELEAKVGQVESELADLKSQYHSDRDRLITLRSQFRVIRDRLCTPCQRHEQFSEAIETAIEGIGDGVRDVEWPRTSARQPLLEPSVVVRDSGRLGRVRPRPAERYQS